MIHVWYRSGTEEEYTELVQLLEDISSYRRDVEEALEKEKEKRKQKEINDKRTGVEMRKSAMETLSRKYLLQKNACCDIFIT